MARLQWVPYVETDRATARLIGAMLRARRRRFRYVAGPVGRTIVEYARRLDTERRNDAD